MNWHIGSFRKWEPYANYPVFAIKNAELGGYQKYRSFRVGNARKRAGAHNCKFFEKIL
jgi:hypothetical protein